jgi:hypothetical protein
MPYINQTAREMVEPQSLRAAETAGELNYQITALAWRYANHSGMSYTTFNEIIGVLECAKQEFYRRIAAPYEDRKRVENGDVYR